METVLHTLANIFVFVINLERQKQRRKTTLELLRACGFSAAQTKVFPAVDGRVLHRSGGRVRKCGKHWRISYDETFG